MLRYIILEILYGIDMGGLVCSSSKTDVWSILKNLQELTFINIVC